MYPFFFSRNASVLKDLVSAAVTRQRPSLDERHDKRVHMRARRLPQYVDRPTEFALGDVLDGDDLARQAGTPVDLVDLVGQRRRALEATVCQHQEEGAGQDIGIVRILLKNAFVVCRCRRNVADGTGVSAGEVLTEDGPFLGRRLAAGRRMRRGPSGPQGPTRQRQPLRAIYRRPTEEHAKSGFIRQPRPGRWTHGTVIVSALSHVC